MKNKKHYLILFSPQIGTYVTTEPRPWARANKNLFPDFNFIDNLPRTDDIVEKIIL